MVWDDDERSRASAWGSYGDLPDEADASTRMLRRFISRAEWARMHCPDGDAAEAASRPDDWPLEEYRDHDFEPRGRIAGYIRSQ